MEITINTGGDKNICGLENAYVYGCYGSPALEDMQGYIFSLCEHCLKELFDSFEIPVEKRYHGPW
jgi:hypothetical protein